MIPFLSKITLKKDKKNGFYGCTMELILFIWVLSVRTWCLSIIACLSLLTVSPLRPSIWQVDGEAVSTISPERIDWQVLSSLPPQSMYLDSASHCVWFQQQSAKIGTCNQQDEDLFWESGKAWKVTEALAADLDRDGRRELVLLVWRPFKPWPVDSFLPHGGRINEFQDRNGLSCHVILVGWDGKKYRELWAGSALKDPLRALSVADLDGDGFEELLALEGAYDVKSSIGKLTIWHWNGFGFRLLNRIEEPFSQYGIISDSQHVYILAN